MNRHPHTMGLGMASRRSRDRLVDTLRQGSITNEKVLSVIGDIPRHEFIDEAFMSRAYDNEALPIGHGQTISQPFVVARMTELLFSAGHTVRTVLEIGTGCGYQTAVLAHMAERVYTVERISALYEQARRRLRKLGYTRIRFKHTDGSWGWEDYAPFDAIMVTAAAARVPESLLKQMKKPARMIIPVGPAGHQVLKVIDRDDEGYVSRDFDAVSFVPLVTEGS